jgi:very-short-patch-repair endonuclease
MARFSGIPRVVREPSVIEPYYPTSHVRRHARRMRRLPTPAERELRAILSSLNRGVLRGRFKTQHVVSGRWIVDFFFPEIRLAIEVDGAVHWSKDQKARDVEKERDCSRFDITLLRIMNADVFGDRDMLVDKLRQGWRKALKRENLLIGTEYARSKGQASGSLRQ